ncbi:MAG: hypothetical protein RL033_5743 [Pseudomonadota bacterium]
MCGAMKTLDPEEQLGYLVARVADRNSRGWLTALRQHDISPRQFSVLAHVVREPGLTQAELARRTMVTPQSMSELIATLLDAGLLSREAIQPGRQAELEVTGLGKALLRKAYPVVEATNRESFAALTGAERQLLGELLRKLLRGPRSKGGAAG